MHALQKRLSDLALQCALPWDILADLPAIVPETIKYTATLGEPGQLRVGPGAQIHPNCKIKCVGRGSRIIIAPGAGLHGPNISVDGEDCTVIIAGQTRLRRVTMNIRGTGSTIVIGEGTTWEGGVLICLSGSLIAIGEDCMFSDGVVLRDDDGHGIFDRTSGERINPPADVVIHAHTWLGNGVRVNKGAVIHEGTIIGQMSIVAGELQPNGLYAGVPARKIRHNVAWGRTPEYADVPARFR